MESINAIHKHKIELAQSVCSDLSTKYKASICSYDSTAVIVEEITEKQLDAICKTLRCSGFYSEQAGTGIITNFGQY